MIPNAFMIRYIKKIFIMGSVFLFFLVLSDSLYAQSSQKELIGRLSISDVLIQPRITSTEKSTNNFDLDRSYFFFSWNMDSQLSAHFGVGKKKLINHNMRLKTNALKVSEYDDFSFFEAFGQLETDYGVVKAGLIPLSFGWEGSHRESEWAFPRTLFYGGDFADDSGSKYTHQNFGLRDYGLSYYVFYKNFYTEAIFHNGENREDMDGQIWHTMRIGWKDHQNGEISISASNGKYRESKGLPAYEFSYGNIFGTYGLKNLFILVEGFIGKEKPRDTTMGISEKKFLDLHMDLSLRMLDQYRSHLRIEHYEPDANVSNDGIKRMMLGLELFNSLETSSLYLWGIKNIEQGNDIANNQLMLIWKVRSLSFF